MLLWYLFTLVTFNMNYVFIFTNYIKPFMFEILILAKSLLIFAISPLRNR
jgi:hypothetical protein